MFLEFMSQLSAHTPWLCMHAGHAIKENRNIPSDIPNPTGVTNRAQPMLDKVPYHVCAASEMQSG